VRYHEDAASAQKAVESVRELLVGTDPMQFAKIMAEVFKRVPGEWAGKAAIDIALMDWVGQKLGIPLYTYFGLDPKDAPLTTFSIGIDTPEITKQKTLEAAEYPVLKVKVGLATDEPTIEAVRSVTKKPLRVDANEGWKDKEEAVRKINWLEDMVVVHVCCRFSRTILVERLVALSAGAASAAILPAAGATAAVVRNLRRFISASSRPRTVCSSRHRSDHRCAPSGSREWWR